MLIAGLGWLCLRLLLPFVQPTPNEFRCTFLAVLPHRRTGLRIPQMETMAQVLCEVSEGLRASEATVKLLTYENRSEYLPVDQGLISEEGGKHYLSVGLLHVNREKNAALVSLPVEADSGAHRVWVNLD